MIEHCCCCYYYARNTQTDNTMNLTLKVYCAIFQIFCKKKVKKKFFFNHIHDGCCKFTSKEILQTKGPLKPYCRPLFWLVSIFLVLCHSASAEAVKKVMLRFIFLIESFIFVFILHSLLPCASMHMCLVWLVLDLVTNRHRLMFKLDNSFESYA